MIMTIIGLLGGIKSVLMGLGVSAAAIYLWWLNRSRRQYKEEAEDWREVQEVREHDAKVDEDIKVEIDRVNAAPDSGLDAELDRVRDYSKASNAKGR